MFRQRAAWRCWGFCRQLLQLRPVMGRTTMPVMLGTLRMHKMARKQRKMAGRNSGVFPAHVATLVHLHSAKQMTA